MDGHSTKTDENGFDDNGLQHAFILASWQEIPSSECISEKDTEDSQLSSFDAIPTGIDEVKSTEFKVVERKPSGASPFIDENGAFSLGVHQEVVGVIGDEENKQLLIPIDQNDANKGTDLKDDLDLPVGPTTTKEEAENAGGRRAKKTSRKVKAKKEKIGLHPEIMDVIRDEENKQLLIPTDHEDAKKGSDLKDDLDLPVGSTTTKEEAENAGGRRAKKTSRKVKAKKEKIGLDPEIMDVIRDEENKQLLIPKDHKDAKKGTEQKDDSDSPVGDTIRKEKAENVDGGSTKNPRKVEAKRAKLRPGRSVKDGGSFKRITDLGILSLLASFWDTFCAKISWTFSVSLTVGILLLMPLVGVDSALTAVPTTTLVVVGTTARMNCSTGLNQPVYWARTLAQSDEQQWLYYGSDGFHSNHADGRFSIDKDEATGRYDIIIADVQPKDAGRYVCIDDSGLGEKATAELVVSDPIKCNSYIPSDGVMGYNVFGIKQDFIQVSCSLSYAGNLSPTLEWSWPGSDVQNDERDVSAKSFVVSRLKLSPSKEHNGVKFQCKANIEGPTLQTIDTGLLWESEAVTVKHAEFAREDVDACPGVELNLICNPQCSYTFERGKDDACRCMYTYHDKRTQQNYHIASYAVNCEDENNSLPAVLIPVAMAAATLVAAVAVACYLKKKKPKWCRPTGNAESGQTSDSNESSEVMIAKSKLADK